MSELKTDHEERLARLEEQYTGMRRDIDALKEQVNTGFNNITAQIDTKLTAQQAFFTGQYNNVTTNLFKALFGLIAGMIAIAGANQAMKFFG